MLTVIGLACDLLGALVLAIGLFRAPVPNYPALYRRDPNEAASDRAFGTVGAVFLSLGFGLQGLDAFGADFSANPTAKALAVVLTFCVGGVAAYGLYGAAYMVYVKRIEKVERSLRTAEQLRKRDAELGRLVRRPNGLKFWHQARVKDPGPLA